MFSFSDYEWDNSCHVCSLYFLVFSKVSIIWLNCFFYKSLFSSIFFFMYSFPSYILVFPAYVVLRQNHIYTSQWGRWQIIGIFYLSISSNKRKVSNLASNTYLLSLLKYYSPIDFYRFGQVCNPYLYHFYHRFIIGLLPWLVYLLPCVWFNQMQNKNKNQTTKIKSACLVKDIVILMIKYI